jgi:hypothetical protein
MIPKEKAKQLVERFRYDVKREYPWMDELYEFEAKQCATISVEEVLNSVIGGNQRIYWEQVKKEIEQL